MLVRTSRGESNALGSFNRGHSLRTEKDAQLQAKQHEIDALKARLDRLEARLK
jgi:hypothetical protein